MQRMGYTLGPSAPPVLELETFDKLFDDNTTTSNTKVVDTPFSAIGKGSSRLPRRHIVRKNCSTRVLYYRRRMLQAVLCLILAAR
jgi:hypothetical protein